MSYVLKYAGYSTTTTAAEPAEQYRLAYSDYPGTAVGPPDPARWIGPPGPMGPPGIDGEDGIDGAPGVDSNSVINVLDHGAVGDGVTDDTAAIQAVLNTYASRAIVLIPATGSPYMVSGITLPSNTDLILNGTVKMISGTSIGGAGVVASTNTSNVIIRGYGMIDGNDPGRLGNVISAGLAPSNVTRLRVSGITLKDAHHWNMNVTGSSDVVFNGITSIGGGAANEFAAGSTNCWLVDSLIDGTTLRDYSFCFYGGVTNSGAVNNVVRNAGAGTTGAAPGIGILSDGSQPAPCRDILIQGNIIHDCSGGGITCINPAGGTQTGIIISDNRCYNNCKIPVAGNADCYVDHTIGLTISDNQFSKSGAASVAIRGIYLDATVSYAIITGNQIFNVGQGRTDGVGIQTNANHVHATGNYIYDNQTTATMQYSVAGGGGAGSAWVGNLTTLPTNFGNTDTTVNANALNGVFTVGGPGGSADHIMAIVGAQSHRAGLQYQTQGQLRWLVGTDGQTDSGSENGSNYVIASYNDSNVLQSAALMVRRADNAVLLLNRVETRARVNMTNLPTSATGLVAGDVWRNGAVLNIV